MQCFSIEAKEINELFEMDAHNISPPKPYIYETKN